MIYLVPERDNLFPTTDGYASPQVTLGFKAESPLNGGSYASPTLGSFQSKSTGKLTIPSDVKEDDVDMQLEKIDGRIPRNRDAQL
jgi:hypothetical protein